MAEEDSPIQTSSDYDANAPYWHMVNAILCGAEALRATTSGSVPGPHVPYQNLAQLRVRGRSGPVSPYLPQFENESDADYQIRRLNAPLTNIYADISSNLASKPFSKELELDEATGDDLKKLAENIDGQGNNLHVFAREVFKSGLDKGIHWILVDHTNVPEGATLADERAMGARPYWVHIPAERMLAVYSVFFGGQEVITHARIYEPVTRRVGYGEQLVRRVRHLDRAEVYDEAGNLIGLGAATWTVYEEITAGEGSAKKTSWQEVATGIITLGEITLVPYLTGSREGSSWRVTPPLHDLAHMQIEEFQQESNLKTIKEMTAFPMLAGNGVAPATGPDGSEVVVPVGPRGVLFAPPNADGSHGEWAFIEPSAQSLTFLQSDLEKLRGEMRNLGMQPMATANLTVVTTANVSMKAHNAVQAWALGLKDALEQAMKLTCRWLKQDKEPTVNVYTDFGVDLEGGKELDALLKAESQGVVSKRTVQDEFKRRGVLSDDFDPTEEEQRLAEQQQGQDLQPDQTIDPVTGKGIIMEPKIQPVIAPSRPTVN